MLYQITKISDNPNNGEVLITKIHTIFGIKFKGKSKVKYLPHESIKVFNYYFSKGCYVSNKRIEKKRNKFLLIFINNSSPHMFYGKRYETNKDTIIYLCSNSLYNFFNEIPDNLYIIQI